MLAPLRCPTCSAPLEVPSEFATTTRCTYCGAGVLLTERGGHVEPAAAQQRHADAVGDVLRHLRAGSKIAAIKAYHEHFGVGLAEAKHAVDRLEAGQPGASTAPTMAGAAPAGRRAGPAPRSTATWAFVGVLVALIAGAFVYDAMKTRPAAPAPPAGPAATAPASPAPASPIDRQREESGLATEVLRFGSQGNGAGRFEDARGVAVDGAGRIYVAEYSGGRVQVFDSAGTFLTQWMADPKMPLVDLAADRQGTVYVVQSGRIRRFEGATGRALGEFPRATNIGYDDVTVALDGSLWAATMQTVVHLDRNGKVLRTIDIKEAVDEDATPERVAVSGDGHLYVLDQWKGDIYHLDPDGRFVDRFGGGRGGTADMTPEALAVDGRGRIYVSDMGAGVRVFDTAGQELGSFGGGVVFGIAFNDRDELFASRRNDYQVVKYQLAR
ncbi:MAG TPA: NHL repeat-containing protein [Longimicrobium sp.]|jgi:sugar lactone lactonase YvrE/DNA-directed RNA polymerase subunit RPC12/RpoP|nr:NHL repeat-containing protein [Longimicrobium sp.]